MPNLIPDPPVPFTMPRVQCTACGHDIDTHQGLRAAEHHRPAANREPRLVQEPGCIRSSCPCRWTPNDIAGTIVGHLRGQLVTRTSDLIAREF